MAKDMSHHLNELSRNRSPSSLKELYKYMNLKGMSESARSESLLTLLSHYGRRYVFFFGRADIRYSSPRAIPL